MRSTLALTLGRPYLRWAARRQLDGVFASGIERTRALLAEGPVIFAANHVSWWDGPLAVLADAETGATSQFLVDAENLAKVPFLRWFGAIDLDRSSPLAARHGLKRAVSWLDGPTRAVWIYPQGRQRPAHLRPMELKPGAGWLARKTQATVIPVAVQYGWGETAQPRAALSFGAPNPANLETALAEQRVELDAFFDGTKSMPRLIVGPNASPAGGLGARLLAATAPGAQA
ncbi:MAG: lysophospholipid acyltransferase family protein [Proteobacteria bacterium]|nr:lysophospholipid acyltransferase family protein [Pseudomonadota bacterium]